MKTKLSVPLLFFCMVVLCACKKDSRPAPQVKQQGYDLENALVNFSINGELVSAMIDTVNNTVTVAVPDSLNQHNLTANISVANGISAKLNNTTAGGSISFDFTQLVTLTLSTSNGQQNISFKIIVENETQYIGLIGTITAQKSLNKTYKFYFDQFDGSTYQAINCGPTVTTMAIKWADSTFNKTPSYARSVIRPQGGWWLTGDVQSYLLQNGINNAVDTLKNIDSLVKTNIDNDNLIILCLDMYSVPLNTIQYQHTQKFYETNAPGWGHFLLVKGYRQLSTGFYLEIYDPYSDGEHYPGFDYAQIKGQDRYYADDNIKFAAGIWWPYVITVAPKGKKVANLAKFQLNSIAAHKPIPSASGK
ncbi:MAG TPA: hypothetical protein VFE53_17595 [Mucilaginibacter sp.]|jgi:hypothetical protein|nr:hypothetical protein [Mucilaginibacter sp.]